MFFEKKFFELTFWFYRERSRVPMITLRLSKLFSWVRNTFPEEQKLADCISGHFKKLCFWSNFGIFTSKPLILRKILSDGFGRLFFEWKEAVMTSLVIFKMFYWARGTHSKRYLVSNYISDHFTNFSFLVIFRDF